MSLVTNTMYTFELPNVEEIKIELGEVSVAITELVPGRRYKALDTAKNKLLSLDRVKSWLGPVDVKTAEMMNEERITFIAMGTVK